MTETITVQQLADLLTHAARRHLMMDDFVSPATELITVQQLADLLNTRDLDIIDVREENDWATGHVPGARSLTLEQMRADPDRALPQRDGLVFVCAKGVRSLQAARLAERLGYTSVYSLEGGTNAWAQAGLHLVMERRAA